jgi:hypothetical protein
MSRMLLILGVCVCVCVFVASPFLFLDGKMVNFGDCSLTVLASLRLETMWMRLFHDGTKRKHPFW